MKAILVKMALRACAWLASASNVLSHHLLSADVS